MPTEGGTDMEEIKDIVFELIEKEYICDLNDLCQRCRARMGRDHYISKEDIRKATKEYKIFRFGNKSTLITPGRIKAFQYFDRGLSVHDVWPLLPEVKNKNTIIRYMEEWKESKDMKNAREETIRKRRSLTHHYGSGTVFGPWTNRKQVWES